MPKHVWSLSVKSDSGAGPVDTVTVTGPVEANVGKSGAASDCQVGINDVVEVDIVITVANIASFYMESDQPMRVRVNSEVSPSQEFNLLAKIAHGWNNLDLPHGVTNPLTVNITKLFLFNAGAKIANFQAGFILNQDTVTS
jgi:hypothetical protein